MTEMSRAELLATVHVLQPGDLLVIKMPAPEDEATLEATQEIGRELGAIADEVGIRAVVLVGDMTIEAWRQGSE